MQINCKGNLISLSKPKVMGIINATHDSFYALSRKTNRDEAVRKVEQMLEDRADFIDLGGVSTRPGASTVSEEDELNRVIPMLKEILKFFPEVLISIDTYRSKVAREAIHAGACMINDISAGDLDENMFETVAELQIPYVLMHMQGTPQTMQVNPQYENVVVEINQFLSEKLFQLKKLGVNDILIDPGFGFGKNLSHNYELMKNLDLIGFDEIPLLVGVSRKSMITKLFNIPASEALNGTTVLHTIALQKGAKILRVHDVKEAKEAIQIYEMIKPVRVFPKAGK